MEAEVELPTEERVSSEIARVLRDCLRLTRPVEPGLDLARDLQLDSVALLTVVVELERVFGVELHEEDAGEVRTVQELAALVVRRAAEARGGRAP